MFKIVSSLMAWWPVSFPGVAEDGSIVENTFELRFRILDEDEHIAFVKASSEKEGLSIGASMSAPSSVAVEILAPIVVDWRRVAAENGEPLKFDLEHFQQLLKVPNVLPAIVTAYGDCRAGRQKVREGN